MSFRGGGRGRGGGGRGGGGRGGGFGAGRPVTTKLFVANLPTDCKTADLKKLFDPHGDVVECDVVKDYAFVHYASDDEAQAACDAINGTIFNGAELRVEQSRSKVRQRPGMGGQGECFACGGTGHWSRDCPSGPTRPPGPPRDFYPDPRDRLPDPRDYRRRDPRDLLDDRIDRDRYLDYYRSRYAPLSLSPYDRYRPYSDDPYDRLSRLLPRSLPRDPYERPPPEYYRGRSPPPPERDPYFTRDIYGETARYSAVLRSRDSESRRPAPY